MRFKKYLFLLVFFSILLPSQGQVLPIYSKHYSQLDGLPDRTVFDVYENSKGVMWISTPSGLSIFDGSRFTNFSNVSFTNVSKIINIRGAGKIIEDGKQNLIIRPNGFRDSLEILNFSSFESYGVSLRNSNFLEGELIDAFGIPQGDFFILRRSSTHLLIYKWIENQDFELILKIESSSFGGEKEDKLIAKEKGEFWVFDYYEQKIIHLSKDSTKEFFPFIQDSKKNQSLDIFHNSKDGRLWISSLESNTFQFIEKGGSEILPYEIPVPIYNFNQVWEDKIGNMIISHQDGFYSQKLSLIRYDYKNTDLEKIRNLESKITCIRGEDFSKVFHLSSYNGFYQFVIGEENKNIQNILSQSLQGGQFGNVMRGFASDQNGKIYAAEEGSFWYELDTEDFSIDKLVVKDSLGKAMEKMSCGGNLIFEKEFLWGISCDQNEGGRIHSYHPKTKTWDLWYLPEKELIPRMILKKSKDEFWVFTIHREERNGNVLIFNKSTGEFTFYGEGEEKKSVLKSSIINFAVDDQNGNIWIGTSDGLVKMDIEKNIFRKFRIDQQVKNRNHISTILDLNDDKMWIGTQGYGLFVFDKKNNKFSNFTLNHNENFSHFGNTSIFPNNNIGGILKATENEFIVSTYFGFTYLNLETKTTRNYFQKDGFSNNEFNRLSLFQDEKKNIYLGGINGFDVFKTDDLKVRKTHPAPVITQFFTLDEDSEKEQNYFNNLDFPQPLTIKPGNYYFGFNFILPNYFKPENNSFQTWLEGWESDYNTPTNTPSIRFNRLPPGEYKLHIKGKDDRGNASISDLIIPIHVKQYFYKTWWFLILFSSALIGAVIFFVKRKIDGDRKIVEKEKERKENQRRFLELELKTLRMQLNPHFMFNALSAIQFFIKENDSRLAINYLGDFARLMRLFLESSKQKYVTLEDELELLQLYVELERMRFSNKFDVVYEIDESMDLGMVEIPSLLLQPFVENAINHGLRHKEGKGLLTIKLIFEESNQSLTCFIEDDGIGRKRSEEIRKQSLKKHKSRGTQLIEERLATFNASGEVKLEVKTEDANLVATELEDCGTRVTLTIPNID